MVLNTLAYIVVLIVVVILIVVLLKFLFGVLAIAPIVAYGTTVDAEQQEKDVANQDEQKTVDKATIKTNDTDITITCTSNIPNLVSCD